MERVAKHLRFNLRTKAAVLKREKVEYFTGSAAVDTLMSSKWVKKLEEETTEEEKRPQKKGGDDNKSVEFYTRADAVSFCNYLVDLRYMVRVNKVEVKLASDAPDTGDEEPRQPASKPAGKSGGTEEPEQPAKKPAGKSGGTEEPEQPAKKPAGKSGGTEESEQPAKKPAGKSGGTEEPEQPAKKPAGKSGGTEEPEQPAKKLTKPKSKPEESGTTTKKRKKRYKFEVHPKQQFRDGEDLYIWKYNPPSTSTYVIGFIVVLGAIAWTLQPLWPESTKVGMWYVAMAAVCVIGVLLVLLVLRWFLFGVVLISTLGKVHFWVFPNLNEEKYGFVDSFKPVYSIEGSGDS